MYQSQAIAPKVPKVDSARDTKDEYSQYSGRSISLDWAAPAALGQPVIHDDELAFDPLKFHEKAKNEDKQGIITFHMIYNDGSREFLEKLTALKEIFSAQLPFMPKDYIWRIVFDPFIISFHFITLRFAFFITHRQLLCLSQPLSSQSCHSSW